MSYLSTVFPLAPAAVPTADRAPRIDDRSAWIQRRGAPPGSGTGADTPPSLSRQPRAGFSREGLCQAVPAGGILHFFPPPPRRKTNAGRGLPAQDRCLRTEGAPHGTPRG